MSINNVMPSVTYFDMGRVNAVEVYVSPPQDPNEDTRRRIHNWLSVMYDDLRMPSSLQCCSTIEPNPKPQKRPRFSFEFENLLRKRITHMGIERNVEWTSLRKSGNVEGPCPEHLGCQIPRCYIT